MSRGEIAGAGENTRFGVGNKAAVGADHRLHGLYKRKAFRSLCEEYLLDPKKGFAALQQIADGYKGVKPTDRISAISLMAKVCGMLSERIEIERVDPVREMRDEELLEMARQSLKVLDLDNGNGTNGSDKGDSQRTESA